jgi:hypothetical protein
MTGQDGSILISASGAVTAEAYEGKGRLPYCIKRVRANMGQYIGQRPFRASESHTLSARPLELKLYILHLAI